MDGDPAVFGDADDPLPPDTDGDKVPDYHDLDSDNDGIDDVIEGGNATLVANHDGIVDGADADGDGLIDAADGAPAAFGDANDLGAPDTDNDKVPDYRDLDSDNDGINDVIEGNNAIFDTNHDGVIDGPDTDGDGH